MLLPYPNPVISAAVMHDADLLGVYQQCRKLHKDIQAGETYAEAKNWEPYIVYLMLIGDCMSRELTRRGLGELYQVNLILQHPRNMYPAYWKNILVPAWLHEIVESIPNEVWGPDVYLEELPDVVEAEPTESGDTDVAEAEQEQVDGAQ